MGSTCCETHKGSNYYTLKANSRARTTPSTEMWIHCLSNMECMSSDDGNGGAGWWLWCRGTLGRIYRGFWARETPKSFLENTDRTNQILKVRADVQLGWLWVAERPWYCFSDLGLQVLKVLKHFSVGGSLSLLQKQCYKKIECSDVARHRKQAQTGMQGRKEFMDVWGRGVFEVVRFLNFS